MTKRRLKFPLIAEKQHFAPMDFKCVWCRKNRVGEPHSMAMLSGGLVATPKATGDEEAYLNMTWHGGHYIEARPPVEAYEVLPIVEDCEFEFTIAFCSTICLRSYLNHCVDELERRVKKAKPGPVDQSLNDIRKRSRAARAKAKTK